MMRRPKTWFATIVLVLVLLAGWGIWQRHSAVASLATTADADASPVVTLVSPKRGPSERDLTLPGDINAWYQAPIFGQVSGYVSMWYKDYGAKVRKGDLLATVETPTLDQEVAQARAQLEVADANYQLAKVTADRWKRLSGTQAVAQQDVDVKVATARAEKAKVDAAASDVGRLEALESFKRLVAPFNGIVTGRFTDIGDYVNAGGGDAGSSGPRQQLFTVADVHKLRIFVSVPQDYSGDLNSGVTATLTLPQYPDRSFAAKFLTTSHAINTQSRTVLTELVVDNPDPVLLPGAYTEVHFRLPTDPHILIVPEQALLFRSRGMEVALVDASGKVHLQPVTLGLNFGTTVQVLRGLKIGDRLIANPSLGLLEGEQVRVAHVPLQNSDDENEEAATSAPKTAP